MASADSSNTGPIPVEFDPSLQNLETQKKTVGGIPILDKTQLPDESKFRFDVMIIILLVLIVIFWAWYFISKQRKRGEKVPTEDPEMQNQEKVMTRRG